MKKIFLLLGLLCTSSLFAQFTYNDGGLGGIQSPNTLATGVVSFSAGYLTLASGDYGATALGSSSEASGIASIAIGDQVTASGDYGATALGFQTIASGDNSIAMGSQTTASGNQSTAMGFNTSAIGVRSIASGSGTTASGSSSIAGGEKSIASGWASTAMGKYTTAQDYLSFAIGSFNKTDETPNPSEFSLLNTAFVIGNGTDDDNRSNAVEVLFDGTTTIAGDLNINSDKKVFFGDLSFIEGATSGTVLVLNANNNILFRPGGSTTVNFEPNGNATIAGDLNINSDARLKANIISLGATLSKLLQIDGKTYTMKKDANHKKKIGLLAQDIEKVFPELVSESNGIKSVNYQGLVPVLINALKEQDSKMNEQEAKLNKQQAEIDELKAIVTKLITP